MKAKKRLLSLLLCGTMLFSLCSQSVLAEASAQDSGVAVSASGLCEHHPEHDEDCGYTEGTAGSRCTHEHTDDCYTEVIDCTHEHDEDCYPQEDVSDNDATPSNAEKREPENCPHICDEDSGCVTKELNCQHEHDDECGYAPATKGTPCGYVCEICAAENSGSTSGHSGQKQEEEVEPDGEACICTDPCSEDDVNLDCPVCGIEDADLALCKGAEPETATPSNATQLYAGEVQKLIDELPTADELAAMSLEEQQAVYTKLQAAYEAYNALTDKQKAEVAGAEIFDSLFDYFNGIVNTLATENGVKYLDEDGNRQTRDNVTVVEKSTTTWNSGWYVVNDDIEIDTRITVNGEVYLILADNVTLNAKPGISVTKNNSFTIYAQSINEETMGALNAGSTDNYADAGIGGDAGWSSGDVNSDAGSITVNGGRITANGCVGAAIGGGGRSVMYATGGNGGTITINGGTVSVYTSAGGAAIGGGSGWFGGDAGTITINGGTVHAGRYWGGTAIGGATSPNASGGNGGTISISGGAYVTASGIGSGSGGADLGNLSLSGDSILVLTDTSLPAYSNTNSWDGLVISKDNSGSIYGGNDFTLTQDVEIPEGVTLNIENGKTLNVSNGATLTNNGSIIGSGTLDGGGDLEGSGTVAETIDNRLRKKSEVNVKIDPSSAVYGSTITITATISKATNTLTRAAAQNKVDFYLGTVDSGNLLGTADVNNNTATLQVSLTDEKWTVGAHTITAEYGGSMGLKSQSGTASLTVTKAVQTGKPTVSVSETTADSITVSASGSGQGGYEYACVEVENANAPTEGWQTSNTFSNRAAGTAYTVFARYAGNEYYEPSSASDGVTVYTAAKAPATSDVTIDYTAETISFADTLEVNTTEDFSGTAILSGGSILDYIGSTLYARVKKNGNIPASEPLSLTLPSRPAAPSVSIAYEAETLTTTPAMQYMITTSGHSGQKWETCGENMGAVAFGWDGSAEVTVKFRTAATSSNFASVETTVTIQTRPQTPTAPVVNDRTNSSIEVAAVSGQEYKLGGGQWQTASGNSIVFDGLDAGQGYTIYTRVKAGTSSFASVEASVVTSTKESPAAAPTVGDSTVTASSVTLPQNSAWEYSTDGSSWSGTYHFTDLEAATKYTYYIRVKETENTEASQAAAISVYTAKAAPGENVGYEVNYGTETLTITNGYEINTTEDFSGTAIASDGSITPGSTYYIRAAVSTSDDGLTIPCSEATGFTLNNRPTAPDTLQGENETFAGDNNGKLSGVSSGMEYRLSTTEQWTTCSGSTVESLAPGTYYVRFKATASAFASGSAAVEIKTGAQRTYTLNVTAPAFEPAAYGYTQPEAKAIIINSTGNSSSTISSVTVDSENFVVGGSGSTVTAGGSLDTWTIRPAVGLDAGTYTATITVNYTGDAKANAQVSFTVNQAEQAAPDNGSELASRDRNSITLKAVPDNGNGAKAEYSRDGGATWQASPAFTGLSSGTKYSFIVRYGATADGNYKASPAGPAVEYSTEKSGGGGASYDYFTITASAGTGGAISPSGSISVREGLDKTFTITPASGYRISDVLVDGQSVGALGSYTFRSVQTRHTIEAVFAKENPGTGTNPFTDVSTNDWFYDDVMFVYENGLMTGTSATTFSPYANTTRAQIAIIFWRLDGSPAVEGKNSFTDVEYGPGTAWYYDAATWAQQNGIMAGYGDGRFGPDDPVTREQLAAIFYRYAQAKGYDVTATGSLDRFTDQGDVSEWAQEAMKWAVGKGIINGKDNNLLDPRGTATRAEIAAMLHRFIESYNLSPAATTTGSGGNGGGTSGWVQRTASPQTGDSFQMGLWLFTLCTSAGALIALLMLKRRDEEESRQFA